MARKAKAKVTARPKVKAPRATTKLLVPVDGSKEWQPISNGELDDLITNLPRLKEKEEAELRQKAFSILANCLSPKAEPGSKTGLVIGRVQSGKTMSFTAVAALARDNHYQLIIIITGTTKPLSAQSVNRLRKDLRISQRNGLKWFFDSNPKENRDSIIQQKLDTWSLKDAADAFKQTVVLTVDKNHRHIGNLCALLTKLNLDGISAIVIDDEADQAGLNSKIRRNEQSTTYAKILELRRLLPSHTYLQYTATPQANLLINKIDVLSPEFVELLEPGEDYVGGEEFFDSGFQKYVVEIPPQELPAIWSANHPPPSLERALRMFLLGACDQVCQSQPEKRSMMVHPSQSTTPHGTYHTWVKNLMENWAIILKKDGADKKSLVAEFREDYQALKATEPGLCEFDRLLANLVQVLAITQLEAPINAANGKTPTMEWANAPFHILVGGQAMDRGFTVEGLSVTYMPRPSGVGNADTIQQRARFFGYKKKYLGVCRIFLEGGVLDSFASYVKHEKDLRKRLQEHKGTKAPLSEWKRKFLLDFSLNPTRSAVLDVDYARGDFDESWFTQHYPASGGAELVEFNRTLVNLLKKHLKFDEFPGHNRRTREQVHQVCSIKLIDLYQEFLVHYKVGDPDDSQNFIGMLMQLKEKLSENSELPAHVVLMSPSMRARERDSATNGKVKKLFQGPNYDKRTSETIYPGDNAIKFNGEFSLQIHMLDLTEGGRITKRDNPTIACWVPHLFKNSWLVE